MKKFKYIVKRIGDWLTFLFTGKGKIAKEAVDAGICDFTGQGRDSVCR